MNFDPVVSPFGFQYPGPFRYIKDGLDFSADGHGFARTGHNSVNEPNQVGAVTLTGSAVTGTGNGLDNQITGNASANVLSGSAGDDSLSGGDGNDQLDGGAGNDVLDGGPGNDVMTGGTGDDVFHVDSAADQVIEAAGEGSDRVLTSIGYRLAAGTEIELLSVANQGATTSLDLAGNEFGQTIFGNDGVNSLEGLGGNDMLWGVGGDDVLDGGAGNDVTIGGAGDDIHVVDGFNDAVLEAAGQGNDRVIATSSYRLSSGAEVEVLTVSDQTGTTAIDLAGSDSAQSIFGNDGVNSLEGIGGNDQLWGLAGNDVLDGGAGDDVAIGGDGDDIYAVDGYNDAIIDGFRQGFFDRVLAYSSYRLGAAAEIEFLFAANQLDDAAIDLMGNGFDQTIIGNEGSNVLEGLGGVDTLRGLGGNDILDGGGGNDWLEGGAGDDIYAVDDVSDVVWEISGGGNDRVYASVSHASLVGEVELLSTANQLGIEEIDLWGNNFGQVIIGNAGTNSIFGAGGNDTLWGLGGNDRLGGGAGNDQLIGGEGADSFQFVSALTAENADIIFGFVAADDTILVDPAVFTGLTPGALNANAFVTATAAQDADDRIIYDSATGNLFFDADGNGSGAALLFATLQGAPTIGAGDFTVLGVGTEFGDFLVGTDGDDTLSGLGGNDALDGGRGADTLTGGPGSDWFILRANYNNNGPGFDFEGMIDFITDFDTAEDIIDLRGFPRFNFDTLFPDQFEIGSVAQDAEDRILYDPSTGNLYFDMDGVGGVAAALFARLTPGTELSWSDFSVFG